MIADTLTQLGIGGVLDFALGYALKKLFKVFLFLLGLYTLSLLYLASKGIIEINYEKLFSKGSGLMDVLQNIKLI